ncbi:hypothetical protein TEA_023643 [Camellia sinensis var. sinensis]|uniref:Uncharacterized protein n=1 Tax=Camellia sinensis var. sinensis TaxID=542762 RepID=A0A4S4CZ79_CAMSN|nr:hypothetical protein TEA_023643 [Camellia sinensis var. sinensis]
MAEDDFSVMKNWVSRNYYPASHALDNGVESGSQISPTVTECVAMEGKKRGSEKLDQKQVVHRKSIDTFGQRTSQYRGVTSSPIESELGSTETETESEEEDGFIAELTRQMADYMLDDDDDDDEVAPSSLPKTTKNPNVGFEANQASSYDQTPAIHLYKFEKQPSINDKGYECGGSRVKRNELTQQLHDKKRHHIPIMQKSVARADDVSAGRIGPSSATTWRPSRQQPIGSDSGSGMRAVFLGGPRLQNGSSGTGVFLPRGTSDPPESRKKSGCSTVLIPARVMQALQLHFEDMNARSKSNGCGGFTSYPLQHGQIVDDDETLVFIFRSPWLWPYSYGRKWYVPYLFAVIFV